MAIEAVNPATGKTIQEYHELSLEEARQIISKVKLSQSQWRWTSFINRSYPMRTAGRVLERRKQELAGLMADEMGKPLREGISEIEKCAWVCEYYADQAESFLTREGVATEAKSSYVAFEPLGVVLAVMPWNFPFWQVFRFAAPALMAGNGAVLKHASNVPGCALAIQEVIQEAGFPESLFRTLLIGSSQVGGLIEDPNIAAVTLTGSTPAGRAVASKAGEMLKKTVLELGGSDPYLILEDADLPAAVKSCVTSRLINSGQSCIAAKRFILVPRVRERFEALFVEEMKAKKYGDPRQPDSDIGPMARRDLAEDLHRQVMESVQRGARLLLGGTLPEGAAAFYPPTILTDVKKGMPAYDEELFGPVASMIPVRDEEEGIRVANDTGFGLGAAVFTEDRVRGEQIALKQLQAGACFVNAFVRSDPRLPFGGVKESGYGRELSAFGIREFVNIKTVYVA